MPLLNPPRRGRVRYGVRPLSLNQTPRLRRARRRLTGRSVFVEGWSQAADALRGAIATFGRSLPAENDLVHQSGDNERQAGGTGQ